VGRRTGMPRTQKVEGRRIEAGGGRDESATQDKVLYPSQGQAPCIRRSCAESSRSSPREAPCVSVCWLLQTTGIGGSRSSQTPGAAWIPRLDKRRANPRKGRRTRSRRRESSQPNRVSEPQGEPTAYGESAEGTSSRWKRAGPSESGRSIPGGLTPAQGPNGATCRMTGVNESGQ
jgi:hypothetical protein